MDKRLVGKWYKEKDQETINIFNEDPLRMKMSFDSSGFYNLEPNCVYIKDNDYCYEINDEYYRIVYHIHYDNGKLKGYYTQFDNTIEITYIKVSNIPDDLPFEKVNMPDIVPNTEYTRYEVLNMYKDYAKQESVKGFQYFLNEPLPEIVNKYNYQDYISNCQKDGDEIAFRLLDFVCDYFGHDGCNGMSRGRRIEDVIEFCEQHNMKTNCRGLSIMLAIFLRANGIKALHITCEPYEEPFEDCHVVVDCILPSGKRIMLDPTYRLYLKDKNNEYVSLPHLREMLINNEEYVPNKNASHNGKEFDLENHRNYMIKNTFRFARQIIAKDGVDNHDVYLIPKGYPIDNFIKSDKDKFVYNDIDFWDE